MQLVIALQRYVRHHRASGSSTHTINAYSRWVGQLAAYLEGQHHSGEIEALAADDLRGWLDDLREHGSPNPQTGRRKPNNDRSVRSKTLHVKAFTRWLVAEGYLVADPFLRVALPKADESAKDTLTPPEIETLLRSCSGTRLTGRRDAAIILVLYSTGIRSAELRGIAVADVDHEQAQIVIRRGKGGKFRIVPLSPKVERAIDRYTNHPKRKAQGLAGMLFLTQEGQPLSSGALPLIFRRLESKTGVHCNPHRWRHSSAVQYLRSGGRLEVLQKLLGHTTLEMSLHYARLAGVDVKAAHETADPTNGIKYRP